MPSFPDSVFAPANRSNGQTIDASHMNGVQDEIVAIEGGYINGTARLNSSVLNVTAGSTFAVRPVEPPPNAVRAFIESTVSLTSAVTVIRGFTAEDFIINSSLHSTGTNSSRFTPQSTGLYRMTAQVRFSVTSSGTRGVVILDSSDAEIADVRVPTDAAQIVFVQAVGVKRFDVTGGYLRAGAVQIGASTLSMSTGSANTWAFMEKL